MKSLFLSLSLILLASVPAFSAPQGQVGPGQIVLLRGWFSDEKSQQSLHDYLSKNLAAGDAIYVEEGLVPLEIENLAHNVAPNLQGLVEAATISKIPYHLDGMTSALFKSFRDGLSRCSGTCIHPSVIPVTETASEKTARLSNALVSLVRTASQARSGSNNVFVVMTPRSASRRFLKLLNASVPAVNVVNLRAAFPRSLCDSLLALSWQI